MGYMSHHAIVVTSNYASAERIEAAHAEAVRLGCTVSPITPVATNGYLSFLIAPDGSKEGWAESDQGDARRNEFIQWIRDNHYIDGGTYIDWAEINFGDDDHEGSMLRSSDWDLADLSDAREGQ